MSDSAESEYVSYRCKCGASFTDEEFADAARHISLFPGECQ